jgi:hypothetical protein
MFPVTPHHGVRFCQGNMELFQELFHCILFTNRLREQDSIKKPFENGRSIAQEVMSYNNNKGRQAPPSTSLHDRDERTRLAAEGSSGADVHRIEDHPLALREGAAAAGGGRVPRLLL